MNHAEEHFSTADFAAAGQSAAREEAPGALLPANLMHELRGRWDHVRTGFAHQPRAAVKQADQLVAQAMIQIAETLANERGRLERKWDRGDDVPTKDLRRTLRKYRSFFQRLLAA
jgi:hypothetical protein